MSIEYLREESWDRISREERYFCCHLFNDLRTKKNLIDFINFLNTTPSLVTGFKNKIALDPEKYWEVGFEVCFYRDILFNFDKPIKQINQKRKKMEAILFPQKRTFDLCLFSNDEIVIIEAKAQQGLDSKQCSEFNDDKKYMEELFEEIGQKCPSIYFIVLASSGYYKSKSFERDNGVGKRFINKNRSTLKGFIAWSQIKRILSNDIYTQADSVYKN